jgi:twitching motility protein PilT
MARLDQLISALVKHAAESLVLTEDTKPALIIEGQARAIVKSPLDLHQMRQLAAEITPPHQRESVLAGETMRFVYRGASVPVNVEIKNREVRIRPFSSTDPPPADPPTEGSLGGPAEPTNPSTASGPGLDPSSAAERPGPTPPPTETTQPAAASPGAPTDPPTAERTPTVSAPLDGSWNMDRLFRLLVEQRGSDLHMSAGCAPMLRIDGGLAALPGAPTFDAESVERILMEITPEPKRLEFAERSDTDFGHAIEGLARFRCNLFRDRKGVGGVFRIIPTKILSADELGLSKTIQDFTRLTKGLVLTTGPTGSGKSTTQAAMLDLINRDRPDHIITIEDPIEFVHENKKCLINQREVPVHTASFKSALRAALREDPDVVLVGELRDLETVAIAIETAETGHLVMGTLHTNSAVSTVDRLIDQFPGEEQSRIRTMLSESLKGVVAQVLCKKIGGGRVAAHEVLVVNAAVANLIREGKTFQIPSIMQTGRGIGMITMSDSLVELVKKKLITPEEGYLRAVDKQSILGAYRSSKIKTDFLNEPMPGKQALQPA